MSLRFTPGSRHRTNAAKSPLFVDEKVMPYWIRSRMLGCAPRMMSRTRRNAASEGGFVDANQRSTAADFGMTGCYSVSRRRPGCHRPVPGRQRLRVRRAEGHEMTEIMVRSGTEQLGGIRLWEG